MANEETGEQGWLLSIYFLDNRLVYFVQFPLVFFFFIIYIYIYDE